MLVALVTQSEVNTTEENVIKCKNQSDCKIGS